MKCRNTINGKCNNKIVNELNPQEDRPPKCGGHFVNETKHCFRPNKKLK